VYVLVYMQTNPKLRLRAGGGGPDVNAGGIVAFVDIDYDDLPIDNQTHQVALCGYKCMNQWIGLPVHVFRERGWRMCFGCLVLMSMCKEICKES